MPRIKNNIKLILLSLTCVWACTGLDTDGGFHLEERERQIAFPIFKSSLSIEAIQENSSADARVEIDAEGQVTLIYNGEVVTRTSEEIFLPVPGIIEIPILDSVFSVPLPLDEGLILEEAIMGNTHVYFRWTSSFREDVSIHLEVPQLTRDGEVFSQDFLIEGIEGGDNVIRSADVSIEDYTLIPDNGEVTFIYQARLPDGTPVVLDNGGMGFDFLDFKYIEGNFGQRVFDISGDIITVDLFNNWESGGILFSDPQLKLSVDNSFGMPTRSNVNQLDIETLDGRILTLESPLLDAGLDFDFPTRDQVGTVLNTTYTFDQSNSNLKALFEEKAVRVVYDVDAIVNPDLPIPTGFFRDDSFFSIDFGLVLPLIGSVDNLVLQETTEVDLGTYDEIESGSIKVIASNDYPLDIHLQVYALDEDRMVIDSIFSEAPYFIEAGRLINDGIDTEASTSELEIVLPAEKIDGILSASFFQIVGRFDSDIDLGPLTFYDRYALSLDMGGILNIVR